MTEGNMTIDNLEISQEVFDRMVARCQALGCTVADFIEQALVYAMDNEDLTEEKTNEGG